MSHMVIYRSADGKAAFQQVDDLNAAVAFVEKIRNEAGVENSRIYRMELVNYRFEPYYQVRLDSGELLSGPPGRVSTPAAAGGPPPAGTPSTSMSGLGGASLPGGAPASAGLGASTPPGGGLGGPGATGTDRPLGATPSASSGSDPAGSGFGSAAGGTNPSSPPSGTSSTTAVDPGEEPPSSSGREENRGGTGNGARRGLFGR